uniref:DUF6824 domain-containing protein n=1 Tax=Amphora coffeiformis TaxID=265554 RepID=A0A7S3LHT3_9STRA|mmetsp:Transcript_16538/g.33365  ORF Transcript_16538/g.33365 Transcript_16538/m.33365 type:complete len:231 (+) Transcript_16538:81-773(+)
MQRRDEVDPAGDEDSSETDEVPVEMNQQDGSEADCSEGENDDDEISTSESPTNPNRASSSFPEDAMFPTDTEATGSSAQQIIAKPYFDDIIGGRGKNSNNHFGNQKYRKLVRDHCEDYHSLATNAKKSRFAEEIVTRVKQDGGRFLKQLDGTGGFVEMDDSESRKKVGQSLRYEYAKIRNADQTAYQTGHHTEDQTESQLADQSATDQTTEQPSDQSGDFSGDEIEKQES